MSEEPKVENEVATNDRRDFLKKAGRFALVAPPTMTMLLSSSMAKATGRGGHSGGDIGKSCDDGKNKMYGGHHVCKPDYDTRDYDDWWDYITDWLKKLGWP